MLDEMATVIPFPIKEPVLDPELENTIRMLSERYDVPKRHIISKAVEHMLLQLSLMSDEQKKDFLQ